MYKPSIALTLLSSAMAGTIEESSCLLYDDLTSWDLRDAAAEPGKYYQANIKAVMAPDVTTPAWTAPAWLGPPNQHGPMIQVHHPAVEHPAVTTKGAEISPAVNMVWNLCSYLDWEKTPDSALAKTQGITAETFAYIVKGGEIIHLTSEILPQTQSVVDESVVDSDGEIIGIDTIFKGDVPCDMSAEDEEEYYGFKYRMICNADITGKAKIVSVTGAATSCQPMVHMEHASGCPLFSFSGIVKFMKENTWLSGTILVVLGIVMVLFGSKFFRWIMAAIGGMIGFMAVMYISSLFGWLGATWSLILWVCLAVVGGLAAGYFTCMLLPISIGLLSAAGGFVVGALIFALILAITGYEALWLLIVLLVGGAITFGILGFKFRDTFLIITTSIVGGYCFMRGTTFWFYNFPNGIYPSEMEMLVQMANGEVVVLYWSFWLYFATFVIVSIFGFVFQTKYYSDEASKAVKDEYFVQM